MVIIISCRSSPLCVLYEFQILIKILSSFNLSIECISLSLFSAPSGESTLKPGVVPETTYCVSEKDPHRDINPQNNNPIDNT